MNPPITRARECDLSLSRLVADALEMHASDIHLDSFGKTSFRVGEELHHGELPPGAEPSRIIAESMRLADLTPGRPGRGRFVIAVADRDVDVVASVVPTIDGDHVVMRLYDAGLLHLDLSEMGLLPEQLEGVRSSIRGRGGLMIAAGPTGSGKTTLLYGMVVEALAPGRSAISIEDPVAFRLRGVHQTEVSETAPFAALFEAAMSHDPDVLMIGAIQDRATVVAAIRAAMSGHTVLSQMNALDTRDVVDRILSAGVMPHALSETLSCVVAMRLVPRKNTDGARRGKAAFYETLVMTPELRAVLSESGSARTVYDTAVSAGMKTLEQTGAMLVSQGTAEEADVKKVLRR